MKFMGRMGSFIKSPAGHALRILKKGPARRIIFFYPGEEGTYIDKADVTLYENGILHIKSNQEETTTHLQNCEILWNFEVDGEERDSKVRLLKTKHIKPTASMIPSAHVPVDEAGGADSNITETPECRD
ncbi:MAG: hypothetical protein AABZ06_03890 [Bdellovibrionota bacterium]